MHLSRLKNLLLCGIGLWLAGCNAPHNNPLDPASPNYRTPADPLRLTGLVHSEHISYYLFPTTDSYAVIAQLSGEDAVLQDSAWVSYDSGNPVGMDRIAPDRWSARFAASNTDPQLETVIGQPFVFTVRDYHGVMTTLDPLFMWRVIADVPKVTSPSAYDTVGAFATLVWEPFSAHFPFGFRAEIISTTQVPAASVWSSGLLQDTARTIQCPDSLPNGDYYWTITVVDSFQNTSRSKQGTFVVEAIAPEPLP
jgi:hypothetical protein